MNTPRIPQIQPQIGAVDARELETALSLNDGRNDGGEQLLQLLGLQGWPEVDLDDRGL